LPPLGTTELIGFEFLKSDIDFSVLSAIFLPIFFDSLNFFNSCEKFKLVFPIKSETASVVSEAASATDAVAFEASFMTLPNSITAPKPGTAAIKSVPTFTAPDAIPAVALVADSFIFSNAVSIGLSSALSEISAISAAFFNVVVNFFL
jgi:hypothetical protein